MLVSLAAPHLGETLQKLCIARFDLLFNGSLGMRYT